MATYVVDASVVIEYFDYIALAKRSNYALISSDQPQQRIANAEGVTLKPLTDF